MGNVRGITKMLNIKGFSGDSGIDRLLPRGEEGARSSIPGACHLLFFFVDVFVHIVGGFYKTINAAAVETLAFELVGQHTAVLGLLE